ncbi:hypothetical protein EDD18DRAFT_1362364 [Armillaria luteobubalina]|uniref:Uncharacterized protein n=1 Tax=Armillaria luteobubalina TaxID=153913 RepID=A0AA39UBB2_9AGAR|nr:hypothetical protein EDD18DRAFT_1362364 [Armillaria luteobubalina]
MPHHSPYPRPLRTRGTRALEKHDPPAHELSLFKEELQTFLDQGKMVTFDESSRCWKEFYRYFQCSYLDDLLVFNLPLDSPLVTLKDGCMRQAEAFEFYLLDPPPVFCPHILNPRRSEEDCTMRLHYRRGFVPVHYYQVPSSNHSCSFQGIYVLNRATIARAHLHPVIVPTLKAVPVAQISDVSVPVSFPVTNHTCFFSPSMAQEGALSDEEYFSVIELLESRGIYSGNLPPSSSFLLLLQYQRNRTYIPHGTRDAA